MTTTIPEAEVSECRVTGCAEPAAGVKVLDREGVLDRVYLCARHNADKIRDIRDRVGGEPVVFTVASSAPDMPAAPLSDTGREALGVEDVTVVGVGARPDTFRAFRCPDDVWDAFLAACSARGHKPHQVIVDMLRRAFENSDPGDGDEDA